MFVDNEDCNQHIVLDTAGLNITSPGAFLVSLETIFHLLSQQTLSQNRVTTNEALLSVHEKYLKEIAIIQVQKQRLLFEK